MEHGRLILAIAIHALSAASAVYLATPAVRHKVKGWHLYLTAGFGGLLGIVLTGNDYGPFPFDPLEPGANPVGKWYGVENFAVGVGMPFVVLAVGMLFTSGGAKKSV